jgi:hypothetical protein
MGFFTQHLNKGSQTGLKTLTNAVELITPQGRGINQEKGSKCKGTANQSGEK